MLIWTMGEMLALPMTSAAAGHHAAAESSGKYMGVYAFTFSVSMVMAPLIGMNLYSKVATTALWWLLSEMGLISCVGYGVLSRIMTLHDPDGDETPSDLEVPAQTERDVDVVG